MANRLKRSAYLPLVGFVIVLVLGVAAWVVAPGIIAWLADTLPFFRGTELPLATTRPIFTALIVVLTLLLVGLITALSAPKDTKHAAASTLERDRASLRRRQKEERDRARKPKGQR